MVSTAQLPVDIWLLVFSEIDDLSLLWLTCRNVSRFWRGCVDEYFTHGVLRKTFIDLLYSDIHTHPGLVYHYIHVPVVFDRLSDDGQTAIFQQREFVEMDASRHRGSIRGWVPFIERYHEEIRQPAPKVSHMERSKEGPMWERELKRQMDMLAARPPQRGRIEHEYFARLREMTSIGRGDRPPYYIKVGDVATDTSFADLSIDVEKREISIDWRRTLAAFFRERYSIANHGWGNLSSYDEKLAAVARNYKSYNVPYDLEHVWARHRRMRRWARKNSHRMGAEVRWAIEAIAEIQRHAVRDALTHGNLRELSEGDDPLEVVPARLAGDNPKILFRPVVRGDIPGCYSDTEWTSPSYTPNYAKRKR